MLRKKQTKLITTLLLGLMSISILGCATKKLVRPPIPVKPQITAVANDGQVCFSREDAAKLALYISELERLLRVY